PLEACVEVISVNALAFKRFLDIARLLEIKTCVVADNDGCAEKLEKRFADYKNATNICLCYSTDDSLKTLETHMVKLNNMDTFNRLFGKAYATEGEVLAFMLENKTDCALKMFDSPDALVMPEYIQNAIR